MQLAPIHTGSLNCPAHLALALTVALAALQGCSNPQYSARRIIEEAGGQVVWEEGKVVQIHLDYAQSAADLLRRLPMIDTVHTLNLDGADITSADVDRLPDWPLETLSFRGTDITEVCLPKILSYHRLKSLVLSETGIETIDGLSQLRQLETIALPPAVGDASLAEVAKCSRLHTIYAAGTQIRGPGLSHLTPENLPNLKTLYLDRTPLAAGALTGLPFHEGLERVTLKMTDAGDEDASHLSTFPRLDFLDFSHSRLSDQGLRNLAELPLLYVLDLDGSKVTLEAMLDVAEQHPALRLTHRSLRDVDDQNKIVN